MCVIVAKNKGVALPKESTLYQCFLSNPNGCGFMYSYNNKVYIEKGFMDFEKFMARIHAIDKQIGLQNHSVVFHFRITTVGTTSKGNCHPFPITDDSESLKKLKLTCNDVAFCHNGTIHNYRPKTKTYSDTQMFSAQVLSVFYRYDEKFYKDYRVMYMLEKLSNSKLCFLDKNENLYYVGQFFEYDNCMFSNLHFKHRTSRIDYWYPNGRI